jgi:sugar transferase EpsL
MRDHWYRQIGKPLLDWTLAGIALIILSPVLVVVAVLVQWNLGSPVLFRQVRPGLNGKLFTMRKFRTMTDARDKRGNLLSDAERLTAFGRFLRTTSLLTQYLDLYTSEQARRHEVFPGITGWAQINGRNAISWEEKFALDVWYVDHQSLRLDLKILFITMGKVLRRSSINQEGHDTMPNFTRGGTK